MKKRLFATLIFAAACLSLLLLFSCKSSAVNPTPTATITATPKPTAVPTATQSALSTPVPTATMVISGNLSVWFIDVGNADCFLIIAPGGKTMLIDAGDAATQTAVAAFLTNKGIQKIDALIATNPDADHTGGMAYIVEHFQIGAAYMPKASRSYGSVSAALKAKNIATTNIKAGSSITLEDSVSVNVIAPIGTGYVSSDDYSAVIRLTYKSTSFLFAGDIRSVSEQEILTAGTNIKSTVLKVSSHGSANASSAEFLKAVAPKYAVISVGVPNDYDYPGRTTLLRLKSVGAEVYRTDTNGTITITSDGTKITVTTVR